MVRRTTWRSLEPAYESIEYDRLRDVCEDYINFLEGAQFHSDRLNRYENIIFEHALEFIYGEGIFEEVGRLLEEQGA